MFKKNKIYCVDCFKFLDKVNDNSVDLAVIDPPYNLRKAEWDTFKSRKDFLDFTFRWIDSLIPKLKDSGSLYVFNTPFNSTYILQYLVEKGLIFQNWIVWDKRDGLASAKRKYVNGQETILFFTKSKNYVFNFEDIRQPYESESRIAHAKLKGIIKNGKRWFPNPHGKLCGEVWHFSSERHKNKINGKTQKMPHLTPKPLDMIERIVKASSKPGDLVLDCFMGIGTTALACKNLKRNFIGSDNNKSYVHTATSRLKNGNVFKKLNSKK